MKDELVSFKTATLAKEKGLEINTYSDCWVKTLDGRIIHNSERKDTSEDGRCEQILMQPTQTYLQRWLRETKKINVWIEHGTKDTYDITISGIGCLRGGYKKYEEALEIGLQKALKSL